MSAVSAAVSTCGGSSAGILGCPARNGVVMEDAKSTWVAPRDIALLLGRLSVFCSGQLALRGWLRLGPSLRQLLDDGINHLQLARIAHGDQQFCVLVIADGWRIRFAEHFPA